jgi:hypothetical protein
MGFSLVEVFQLDPEPSEPQMNFRQFARAPELCYEAEIRRIVPGYAKVSDNKAMQRRKNLARRSAYLQGVAARARSSTG